MNTAVIAEQMLYEIGDPRRLPAARRDLRLHAGAAASSWASTACAVTGARGLPPGPAYKVSATYLDGYRCSAQLTIVGIDAARKAQRTGEAILERTRELFAQRRWLPYRRTHIEVLGSELANYGPARAHAGTCARRCCRWP